MPKTSVNHASYRDNSTSLFASQNAQGRYVNTAPSEDGSGKLGQILWRYISHKVEQKTPKQQLPVQQINWQTSNADSLWRISHSTVLLRLNGEYLLTDPVFAKRASPATWLGPKRFHALPITVNELPDLTAVLISHDHYDHLDKATIQVLMHKTKHFVVPLGVEQHLLRFGVPVAKIIVLDWWQSTAVGHSMVHATPAQHFSGRGLHDKNKTLWASFVIESASKRLFFSGDSGYFAGFSQISKRFGHFDLAMIETGAYDELWPDIHMQPEQSLRAHLDLNADYLLPIHNSSFDLALHSWFDPLERLAQAADAYQVPLLTPIFGQAIPLDTLDAAHQQNMRWWQALMPTQRATAELAIPA